MRINLQSKNMDLTDSISDYVEKRVTNLGKLLTKMEEKGGDFSVSFEVAKTTNHHKAGDIFHANCAVNIDGQNFHASSDKPDLYEAIDEVKENLFRAIRQSKDRKQALFKRGAASVKKMLKGLSKRNPFTSKY